MFMIVSLKDCTTSLTSTLSADVILTVNRSPEDVSLSLRAILLQVQRSNQPPEKKIETLATRYMQTTLQKILNQSRERTHLLLLAKNNVSCSWQSSRIAVQPEIVLPSRIFGGSTINEIASPSYTPDIAVTLNLLFSLFHSPSLMLPHPTTK